MHHPPRLGRRFTETGEERLLRAFFRKDMIAVTDRVQVRRNVKYCDQVGDSTRSAPANIAEGFNRSENHIDEGLERRYVSSDEHERFRTLAKRAIRAAEELKRYLRGRVT